MVLLEDNSAVALDGLWVGEASLDLWGSLGLSSLLSADLSSEVVVLADSESLTSSSLSGDSALEVSDSHLVWLSASLESLELSLGLGESALGDSSLSVFSDLSSGATDGSLLLSESLLKLGLVRANWALFLANSALSSDGLKPDELLIQFSLAFSDWLW